MLSAEATTEEENDTHANVCSLTYIDLLSDILNVFQA
jgi:hypothetical protein